MLGAFNTTTPLLNPARNCTQYLQLVRLYAAIHSPEDHTLPVATSTDRLEAQISTDLNSMLKRAAEIQGRDMPDSPLTQFLPLVTIQRS